MTRKVVEKDQNWTIAKPASTQITHPRIIRLLLNGIEIFIWYKSDPAYTPKRTKVDLRQH